MTQNSFFEPICIIFKLDVNYFVQVIDIWSGHLSRLVKQRTREPEVTPGLIGQMINGDNTNDIDVLG